MAATDNEALLLTVISSSIYHGGKVLNHCGKPSPANKQRCQFGLSNGWRLWWLYLEMNSDYIQCVYVLSINYIIILLYNKYLCQNYYTCITSRYSEFCTQTWNCSTIFTFPVTPVVSVNTSISNKHSVWWHVIKLVCQYRMHVCLLTIIHVHMHVDGHYYNLVLQEIINNLYHKLGGMYCIVHYRPKQ